MFFPPSLDGIIGIRALLLGTCLIRPDLTNVSKGGRGLLARIFSIPRTRNWDLWLRGWGTTYYLDQPYVGKAIIVTNAIFNTAATIITTLITKAIANNWELKLSTANAKEGSCDQPAWLKSDGWRWKFLKIGLGSMKRIHFWSTSKGERVRNSSKWIWKENLCESFVYYLICQAMVPSFIHELLVSAWLTTSNWMLADSIT